MTTCPMSSAVQHLRQNRLQPPLQLQCSTDGRQMHDGRVGRGYNSFQSTQIVHINNVVIFPIAIKSRQEVYSRCYLTS